MSLFMLDVNGLQLNLPRAPLTFRLLEGQLLWVRGENGAGKSTLLKTLLGLIKAQEGAITWSKGRPSLFYLSHELGLQPQLTVLDYCLWHPAIPTKPSQKACQEALSALGILPLAHQLSGHLSRGQKQRLALACARLSGAKLWLLDEPLTALDQEGRERALQALAEHKASGGSAILISHYPIPEIADEVVDLVG